MAKNDPLKHVAHADKNIAYHIEWGFRREAALLRVEACERDRDDLLAVEARLRGFVFAPVAISSSLNAFGIRSCFPPTPICRELIAGPQP